MNYPILITILIFLLCFGRFIWIITHERRSLRAGVSLVITLFSFLFLGVVILVNIADLDPHYKDWILPLFVIALFAVMAGTIIFALTLIIMFFYDGIKRRKPLDKLSFSGHGDFHYLLPIFISSCGTN